MFYLQMGTILQQLPTHSSTSPPAAGNIIPGVSTGGTCQFFTWRPPPAPQDKRARAPQTAQTAPRTQLRRMKSVRSIGSQTEDGNIIIVFIKV